MHELTGDREAVLEIMRQTIFHLGSGAPNIRVKGMKSLGVTSDAQWTKQRDEAIDTLQRAYQRETDKSETNKSDQEKLSAATPKKKPKGGAKVLSFGVAAPSESAAKDWYMPRDRTVAVFQAAMDEFLDQKLADFAIAPGAGKISKKSAKGTLSLAGKSVEPADAKADINLFFTSASVQPKRAMSLAGFEKYDNLDPGWVSVVWEKAKSLLRGKAKFIKHKAKTDFRFNIVDKPVATIALVSDWGGGNDAARAVAKQITARQPDHVIHLGDVYYAGTEHEINNRFLNLWDFWGGTPATAGRSFALNSNHEMYGGGHGYFKTTLKALKQPASYFSLGNKHWRFIGLDTGYVDHDLNAEQLDWLTGQLSGAAKTVLLSHHQPFSAYAGGDSGAKLRARVQPFLSKIYSWIWGHEHLCAIYGTHLGIKGRCIGHGCIPYETPQAEVSAGVPVEWLNDRRQANGRGMHGFALLTLKNEQLEIEYIDQDGTVAKSESF